MGQGQPQCLLLDDRLGVLIQGATLGLVAERLAVGDQLVELGVAEACLLYTSDAADE